MGCFVTSNENRTVITARSIPVNSPLSLSLSLSISTSRIDGVTPGIPDHHQYCDCERGQRRPFPFSTAEVTGQNAWLTKEHANTTLDRAHGRTALTAGSPTPGRRVTSALTRRRRHGRSCPGARVRWAALRGWASPTRAAILSSNTVCRCARPASAVTTGMAASPHQSNQGGGVSLSSQSHSRQPVDEWQSSQRHARVGHGCRPETSVCVTAAPVRPR